MDVQRSYQLTAVRHPAGLTLVECLVSMLAFAIAAGLAVSLFARYGEAVRFADGHSRWTSILIAGERMCQELREAQVLEVGEQQVDMTKLDPTLVGERLNPDPEAIVPADFNPYADAFMVEVRYALDQTALVRTLERPSEQPISTSLVSGLSGLELEQNGSLLTVRLLYKTDTKNHQVEYLVEVPQ